MRGQDDVDPASHRTPAAYREELTQIGVPPTQLLPRPPAALPTRDHPAPGGRCRSSLAGQLSKPLDLFPTLPASRIKPRYLRPALALAPQRPQAKWRHGALFICRSQLRWPGPLLSPSRPSPAPGGSSPGLHRPSRPGCPHGGGRQRYPPHKLATPKGLSATKRAPPGRAGQGDSPPLPGHWRRLPEGSEGGKRESGRAEIPRGPSHTPAAGEPDQTLLWSGEIRGTYPPPPPPPGSHTHTPAPGSSSGGGGTRPSPPSPSSPRRPQDFAGNRALPEGLVPPLPSPTPDPVPSPGSEKRKSGETGTGGRTSRRVSGPRLCFLFGRRRHFYCVAAATRTPTPSNGRATSPARPALPFFPSRRGAAPLPPCQRGRRAPPPWTRPPRAFPPLRLLLRSSATERGGQRLRGAGGRQVRGAGVGAGPCGCRLRDSPPRPAAVTGRGRRGRCLSQRPLACCFGPVLSPSLCVFLYLFT